MTKPNFANASNEDDLQWKTTFNGMRPPKEDDLKILKEEYFMQPLIGSYSHLNLRLTEQTKVYKYFKLVFIGNPRGKLECGSA